jgi:chromosome segregation protein
VFLKSLTLKGFKSFADPAVLEFEPGITVVVGPNGSGKSNVVDAVAWVLGAQGPRTVRSAKMEDVIFMGTASRPALGRAEVSLTIDNGSGQLATELAEITITRTLFRSGDSEYSINGAPCRLLDIQELLSDTGVGRQQHVIISQGHLDAILEARPEDRRSVIEEAAGVLKYRRRRERSERRLASTEENLERLFDLVREVKRQIRPLERQAAAARAYTGLADALRELRLYVAGAELKALDSRHEDGERTRSELRESEEKIGGSLTLLDADTERTADEMSAQRESDLASALGRAEGMVERARGLTGVLRERQRSLAQALDAAADADVVSTLEAEGARLGEELAATEVEAEAMVPEQVTVAEVEAEAAASLEAHLEAWGDGAELRRADEAVTVATGQLGALDHALERDRRSLDQLSSRLAATERRVAVIEGEDHELGERLAEQEQARHRLQATVAETEAAHGRATQRLEGAEEALRQAEQEHHRSVARADALERSLDEARGAAGAELLSGVDGVVGILLDLVELDEGWEDAFEAAAGASVAAVVVSGNAPARSALARLREGGATGAVLALTDPVSGSGAGFGSGQDLPVPPGTESIRPHVRPRSGTGHLPGLDAALDTLLAGAHCAVGGWSEAIDLALARPDLVVVTRDGDRFSSTGWRVRAGGGVVTAAVVDEARARAEVAEVAATQAAEERTAARAAVESTRATAAEAVRADDRNEVDHTTARTARQRVAEDRLALVSELEETRRACAEIEDRIARDTARAVELRQELPRLEEARAAAAAQVAVAREERRRIDERIAEAGALRAEWEARSAGLIERRRVLTERLVEVERRLTGHADERREAAERRTRLEADATAVERLLVVVGSAQTQLDSALAELRERHRRQLEAVRAGGARLEELRRQRSASEHELAAVRVRLQKVELDLVEASIRRESVIELLRHDLACGPDEALAAPAPELPDDTDPVSRIEQLEAELAALGPVNPLALEELSELGERHQFLESQVEDVRAARRELHHVIRTLDEEIMHVFDSAFADVNEHFSTLVTSLFPGGTGRLSLTEPENLLDTGVEIEVRPAGRNVRRLSLLSGGERSLVAMAFLFAVFRSRPSPFYLMDEVEAALDDVNLQRFLGLVHEFREGAQLIIVSHQKRTMEAADALYGVTMAPGGSSKVVSQKVPRQREDGLDWSDRDSGSGASAVSSPPAVGSSSAATDGSSLTDGSSAPTDGSSTPAPEVASSAPTPAAIPEVPVDPVEDPWNDDPWDEDASAVFDGIESEAPRSVDGSDGSDGSDRDWADFTDPIEDDVLEDIVEYTGDGADVEDRSVDPTAVDRTEVDGVEVDRTEDAEDDSIDGGSDRTEDGAVDGEEDDGEDPVDGRIGGATRDLGGGRHPGMWVEDRVEAEPVGGADA